RIGMSLIRLDLGEHLGRAVTGGLGDLDAEVLDSCVVQVEAGLRQRLEGHLAGLRLALEDLRGHLARLLAQGVVIDTFAGDAADLDLLYLAAEDGDTGVERLVEDRGHRAHDRVVGKRGEAVYLAEK